MGEIHAQISGATWRFESTHVQGVGIATMWVTCVHWPGCDDDAEPRHGEFGLGECRSDSAFMVANKWFWDAHGIDYKPVLDAVSRAMVTGDLADVSLTDTPPPHAGEIR